MSHPPKPRLGKRSRVPRGTTPSRRSHRRPNGDGRQAARKGASPVPRARAGAESGDFPGGLFARVLSRAKNSPSARPEVIARYKRLLAEGRYAPDLEKVAERMICEGLLEDLDA
jgi:hypothetical protein